MKTILMGILVVLLAGCGAEVLTTTAIQGELQTEQLKAMKGQLNTTTNTTGRITLEHAIQTYLAEKGDYPPSLDALVPNWLPQVPVEADGTHYDYNPQTGTLAAQ